MMCAVSMIRVCLAWFLLCTVVIAPGAAGRRACSIQYMRNPLSPTVSNSLAGELVQFCADEAQFESF